jgi:glycosyltransferase involved in cell wall biosynthesis
MIINIMLSRGLGGIQQSFLDYSKCLKNAFKVFNVTSKNAEINSKINPDFKLLNINSWDFYSIYKLSKIFTKINPKVIIAHGNRAIKFSYYARILARKKEIKLVGVGHSHKHKWIIKCDKIIGVSEDICEYMKKFGANSKKIVHIPNMLDIDMLEIKNDFATKEANDPPVIGVMSRMVAKKGIDVFLNAVKILKESGVKFKVLLGGDGELLEDAIDLSNKNNTKDVVTFLGWINDKESFYKQIDIFCLPSLKEPFGIVLLEAMHKSKLIVATNIDGPKEIIRDGYSGLLCEANNPQELAEVLLQGILLASNKASNKASGKKDGYEKITKNAYESLISNYSMTSVSQKLISFLDKIVLE